MDFVVGNEPFRGKSRTLENPAPSAKHKRKRTQTHTLYREQAIVVDRTAGGREGRLGCHGCKRTASSRAKALVGRGPDVALTVVRPWTAPSWGKGLAPVSELDRGDGNESPGK